MISGQRLLIGLKAAGVDVSGVMVSEGVATGTASVIVDKNGDNAICVAGGANSRVSCADIDEQAEIITQADVIIMQLEIPQQTVVYVLSEARRHGIDIILNPAPAPEEIDPALLEAEVVIANQDEITSLSGEPVTDIHSAKLAASALVGRGAPAVVATLGRQRRHCRKPPNK